MDILVPVDGSETSINAVRHAAAMARAFEADLHVVHVTDSRTETTEELLERIREVLAEEGVEAEPSVSIDLDLEFRPSNRVGEDVLELVEEGGYDHVVMGHHGAGAVERVILGSAAETVVRAGAVPVTVVP